MDTHVIFRLDKINLKNSTKRIDIQVSIGARPPSREKETFPRFISRSDGLKLHLLTLYSKIDLTQKSAGFFVLQLNSHKTVNDLSSSAS